MDVMHSQSSNQDLLCCRACLATDCKLYNIHENKLAEAFSRILGSPVLKDKLPQYLCSYCCCLLLKCASFRATCLETQKRLILELLNGELNTDCILKLDRPSHRLNLTLSVVNILEFVETPTTNIKQELNVLNVINTCETADTAVTCEENLNTDDFKLNETSIDDVNIGLSSIDDDNLSVSGSGIDEVNGSEPHIDNEDIDNYVHSNKQNADSIKKCVNKNNEVKSYDNIDDYEKNRLFVNKVNTIKTYQKKDGITAKKKLIEIQGHSDKLKEKIGENEDFSLGETMIDVNIGESRLDEINLSETNVVDINLSQSHVGDRNSSGPNIDEPHVDVINFSDPQFDDINLSDSDIDDSVG